MRHIYEHFVSTNVDSVNNQLTHWVEDSMATGFCQCNLPIDPQLSEKDLLQRVHLRAGRLL